MWINCTEYLFLVSMRARDWKTIMFFFNRQFLTLDLISSSQGMSWYLPLNRPIGWYVIAIIIWYGFYCISLRNTNNKILTRGNDSFILIQDLALVFKWLWICCHLDLSNRSIKKCYRTTLVQIHVSGWVTFTLVTQVCVYTCARGGAPSRWWRFDVRPSSLREFRPHRGYPSKSCIKKCIIKLIIVIYAR